MSSYHIVNSKILDKEYMIKDAEVVVEDGIITAIGDGLPRQKNRTLIDAKGNLIMPGLRNAHTHSGMTLLRGYAEDLPLNDWLHKSVFPFENFMTEEDVYWGTKLAILEYVRNGITAIGEMYLAEGYFKAAAEDGIRITGIGSVSDVNGNTEAQLQQLEKYFDIYNKGGTVKMMLGYHAEYTASDQLLAGVAELAAKYKAPVCCHMSETAFEVANCMRNRGMTPFKLADKFGIFNYGGVIYHAVYLSHEEMDLARERGVYVITNPSSNLKLASGIASVYEMAGRGVKVAIGTDGPASNNALDMFREMYLTAVLQKYKTGNPAVMPPRDILDMCIRNGALALGWTDYAIEAGCAADLIMVDINTPNMHPHHDIVNNLVYSCSGANVIMTMIDGKILYRDGEFYLNTPKEEVYKNCDRIIKRIKTAL